MLADGGHGFQNLGRRGARFQTALRGKLIHQTVGQRVAERHAQFQNIHARLVKGHSQIARGLQIGIARADINDETLFAGLFELDKLFDDAVHAPESFEFQVSSFKRDLSQVLILIIIVIIILFTGAITIKSRIKIKMNQI